MTTTRTLWTIAGALGVGLIMFALLYVGAPGALYLQDLIGGAKYQANFAALVHIIGVGSIFISLILIAAAGWIVWALIRMWRRRPAE